MRGTSFRQNSDFKTIISGLRINLFQPIQHIPAHVGEQEFPGIQHRQMIHEGPVIEMIVDVLFVKIAFGNQQIRIFQDGDEAVKPLRISGIGNCLIADFKPKGQDKTSGSGLHS